VSHWAGVKWGPGVFKQPRAVLVSYEAALHFVFRNAIICKNNIPHNSMAIHRRPPANTIIGAFADSACKTCNAMIPEVAMQPSTKIKPTCTKRRQGVTEFLNVFMLN